MPVTTTEHFSVHTKIATATDKERSDLREEAIETLECSSMIIGAQGRLEPDLKKEFDLATEILVRIEGLEKGKGWWFRTKRRLQLTNLYFKKHQHLSKPMRDRL